MTKKQLYIVIHGRRPGIYTRWFGVGGAAEQVAGLPEAIYKGFATRAEAMEWLRSFPQQTLLELAPALYEALGAEQDASPTLAEQIAGLLAAGQVVIFTDGSADPHTGVGGYAAVLRYGKARKEIAGGFRQTTNNRMEIRACIEALRLLKRPSEVVLFCDSQYVVNAMTRGWARSWQANGWLRKEGQPAENADLWAQLLALCEKHQVKFQWVRGHNHAPENERCDLLALQARQRSDWPPDVRGKEK